MREPALVLKLLKYFANLGVLDSYAVEEQHRVRHSNVLSIITWLLYFGYIFYGIFIESLFTSVFAAFLVGGISVVFWLNATHLHSTSKILASLVSNFSVWFAHHSFPIDHAILTTFFPIAASYIYLYDPVKEKWPMITSFGIAALAFVASLTVPRHLILHIPLSAEVVAMSNASHIYISLSLMMLLLVAVVASKSSINRSFKAEKDKASEALSQLLQTQQKLVESEKMAMLGFLSAGLNHEINNPLTFMFGALQTLEDPETGDLEQQESLDSLKLGMTRISEIVKSLRNFTHESDYMDHDCHIHEILDTCSSMVRTRKNLQVIVFKDYDRGPDAVKGNTGKLHQLFLNLLVNAAQAISKGGIIQIRTKFDTTHCQIEISDNGIGISEASLPYVFDPFFTTRVSGEGTGLGLSISKAIVTEHHGHIQVDSNDGKGTRVTIRLPIRGKVQPADPT